MPLSAELSPMASRFRSLSKPTLSLVKSAISRRALNSRPTTSLSTIRSSLSLSRSFPQLGCVQSLLPHHTAVSSVHLISSKSSRSLSKGLDRSVPP